MRSRLYIDGYNFYYSIKESSELPMYLGWCDFRRLGERFLLAEDEVLGPIKYFTAPVGRLGAEGEKGRQSAWLGAVQTISDLELVLDFHAKHPGRRRTEKQTDVNIAVHMLLDAMTDPNCDRVVLVSADIDLAPSVHAIASMIPTPKSVDVWFPSGASG